jgi:hypothetical protein
VWEGIELSRRKRGISIGDLTINTTGTKNHEIIEFTVGRTIKDVKFGFNKITFVLDDGTQITPQLVDGVMSIDIAYFKRFFVLS